MTDDCFAPDFKPIPYWWERTPPPADLPPADPQAGPDDRPEPPAEADVVVIGAGYTGLNAALQTARAGRSTVVLDAEAAGFGCSTRNGGQISTSIKPGYADLARRHGAEAARAILSEGRNALAWIEEFIAAEGLACDFARVGRFHAAHNAYRFRELQAAAAAPPPPGLDKPPMEVVPPERVRDELGTDAYHGGVVFPQHAALDPGAYHAGLLGAAVNAGAQVLPHTPALSIARDGAAHIVTTPRGAIRAGAVAIATNGYTGPFAPWHRRRVIPIGSYVIATEPLPRDLMDRLFPTRRIVSDTRRVVYYYRPSPDGTRVLFGGRVSASETDPRVSGPKLHRELARLFPELREARISHSWCGFVAYTFDTLAHTGGRDGLYYAMGYCGSGVSMASYLGMKLGLKLLDHPEGRTGFDGIPFPTRPLYSGDPWFLAASVQLYRALDAWR
ncbi:MAG: FAD-binding oxidoreductase [Alphaproteobacteria bacterium]|nr:FAD-binding oxidoreductase [Alphaproteobacteria bacterium]